MQTNYSGPSSSSWGRWALAVAAVAIVVAGCDTGPTIAQVSGKVTFQGDPISEGVINFASESGFSIQAPLAGDGSYRLQSHLGKGIPVGSYKVSIAPPPFDPVPADMSKPQLILPEFADIPHKFRSLESSGLEAEVGPDANVFDFDMQP